MLILTRKPGESIYIGENIKITIVELKGHQIRVGIDAPTEMRILREEIYLQILEENKQAAQAAMDVDSGLESLSAVWPSKAKGGSPLFGGKGEIKGIGRTKLNKEAPGEPEIVVRRKKPKKTDE